jgi:hypothetical protein
MSVVSGPLSVVANAWWLASASLPLSHTTIIPKQLTATHGRATDN